MTRERNGTVTSDARGPAFPPLPTDGPAVDPYTRPPYEPPSLPAERDVVHSLSDTKGSDDTTTSALPAERNEPVTAAGREWLPYLVNRLPDEALPIKYGHVADAISAIEREAAMPSVEISVLHLSWAIDDHAMVMATEPTHDGGTCTTDCAGDIRARYLTRERNGQ